MKHVYLTMDAIKAALEGHAITLTEAKELEQTLQRCKNNTHHGQHQKAS